MVRSAQVVINDHTRLVVADPGRIKAETFDIWDSASCDKYHPGANSCLTPDGL